MNEHVNKNNCDQKSVSIMYSIANQICFGRKVNLKKKMPK